MVRLFYKANIPKIPLFVPAEASAIFKTSMNNFFQEVETIGLSVARQETPRGATGQLADSITFSRPSFLAAKIEWTAPYAAPVADGSRPHFSPLRRLSEWTAVKWGDPDKGEILRDIIVSRGTRPNKYPKRTKSKVEKAARRLWPQKISEFVRRILR